MSQPSIRPWAGALTALGFLLVSQHALPLAAAQQPLPGARTEAILQGVVVYESTGQPVDSATLFLIGTDLETHTERDGGFAFLDAPHGMVSVRVTAPGHPSLVQEVEVKRDEIAFVRFLLPTVAAVLSELLVRVPGDEPMAGLLTAADLLAIEVPNARVTSSNAGKTDYAIRLRASPNSFLLSLEPLILVDGVRIGVGQAFEVLSQIPASDVEDIEVLRGPTAAFLYPMAANGVVLVRTRAGGGRRR